MLLQQFNIFSPSCLALVRTKWRLFHYHRPHRGWHQTERIVRNTMYVYDHSHQMYGVLTPSLIPGLLMPFICPYLWVRPLSVNSASFILWRFFFYKLISRISNPTKKSLKVECGGWLSYNYCRDYNMTFNKMCSLCFVFLHFRYIIFII